ncbi:hypothetical protein ACM40_13895 [Chryseobacterium sp. BLS98]|jgi:hypothetical protein|uniref:hypothetical protein n=1 Tax=Chryseobacterium sp. BLS98 TaxID=885586 RepID=UPI00065AD8C0|nr:hypothetical protein [Chryseobacterium sp. BLS98]KMQ60816.1 hypothetical protein ACM40_13895 [Chryseobacterium sp. BLS98]
MKKIITSSAILLSVFAFSQVAIGKASISTLSDNVTPNPSISLEFGTGNRGILLPWVTSAAAVNGVVNGTLIYDTTDKKVKVKLASGWKDLSVDTTGIIDTTLQNSLTELTKAKVQIGGNPATDITPGILVLAATDKAMILPKTTYNAIVNPAAGMMVYDTTAKQLAVFNGTVWSFWKP